MLTMRTNYGGSIERTVASTYRLLLGQGRLQILNVLAPDGGGPSTNPPTESSGAGGSSSSPSSSSSSASVSVSPSGSNTSAEGPTGILPPAQRNGRPAWPLKTGGRIFKLLNIGTHYSPIVDREARLIGTLYPGMAACVYLSRNDTFAGTWHMETIEAFASSGSVSFSEPPTESDDDRITVGSGGSGIFSDPL